MKKSVARQLRLTYALRSSAKSCVTVPSRVRRSTSQNASAPPRPPAPNHFPLYNICKIGNIPVVYACITRYDIPNSLGLPPPKAIPWEPHGAAKNPAKKEKPWPKEQKMGFSKQTIAKNRNKLLKMQKNCEKCKNIAEFQGFPAPNHPKVFPNGS